MGSRLGLEFALPFASVVLQCVLSCVLDVGWILSMGQVFGVGGKIGGSVAPNPRK